ncbi:YdcH family protein [Pseudochrobactrum sp. HB0163]|uniref:YdcH family protein n=1 Tax=Pseudochrobactrum sp. HB0163 TaxID=3450708 RepID=UPI003F6E2EC6
MMALESHLASLEKKHDALEKEISDAAALPATDTLTITDLKRKKLYLKEQIEKLKNQVTRH